MASFAGAGFGGFNADFDAARLFTLREPLLSAGALRGARLASMPREKREAQIVFYDNVALTPEEVKKL
ncbi:MAG: hypothetical protein LBG73_09555 [Spirochaetaceae bacterium]|nr:hypothetical protein [Spirochaetaceae bacterium]